jgi:hypothetical protein
MVLRFMLFPLWTMARIELVTTPARPVRDRDHGVAAAAGAGSWGEACGVSNHHERTSSERGSGGESGYGVGRGFYGGHGKVPGSIDGRVCAAEVERSTGGGNG